MKKLAVLMLLAATLAACAPPTPQVIKETVVVTKPVEVTKVVEKEVVVTPTPTPKGTVTLKVWIRGGAWYDHYTKIVEKWNATHPDIQVVMESIPAAKSTEEAIITAVATGSQPDLVDGMLPCMGSLFGQFGTAVPLDTFPDFWEFAKARQMEPIIRKTMWKGHVYVIPEHIFSLMMIWNLDLLKELGATEPPRTYGEFLELAAKLKEKYPDKYALGMITKPKWWYRWGDFFMFYAAASEGAPFLVEGKDEKGNPILQVALDSEPAKKVAEFVATLAENGYIPKEYMTLDSFYAGNVLASCDAFHGLPRFIEETYPDFNYVLSPPLVPDDYPADKPIWTDGGFKGMLMFSSCKHKEEAWEFMKFVFTEEHDAQLLEIVAAPPCRVDLATNPAFQKVLDTFPPQFKRFVEMAPRTIIYPVHPKHMDLWEAFSEQAWEPLVTGKKGPDEALADAKRKMESILEKP